MAGQAIRPTQFIFTYGVSSIIETSEGPVIIKSFDRWGKIFTLGHTLSVEDFMIEGSEIFSNILDGNVFRIPTNLDLNMPDNQPIFHTGIFPKWALCVIHGKLFEYSNTKTMCEGCKRESRPSIEIKKQAIRFVRACSDGHLDDLDWYGLIHDRSSMSCGSKVFTWESSGSTLDKVTISCDKCGSSMKLKDVYKKTQFMPCSGRYPENDTKDKSCKKESVVTLRGSSNLRIPEIITALYIRGDNTPLHRIFLENHDLKTLLKFESELTKEKLLEKLSNFEKSDPGKFSPMVRTTIMKAEPKLLDSVIKDVRRIYNNLPKGEDDLRRDEFKALIDASEYGRPPDPNLEDPDFQVKLENVVDDVPFYSHKLRITPVEKLSVIVVQKGYKRLDTENKLVKTFYAHQDKKWFPGVKLKGEGIFIDSKFPLKIQSNEWMKMYKNTGDAYQHPLAVWWHTLSHRLISTLSVDSGYSSASIREMVYVDVDTKTDIATGGILLFTSQQGGDGSLGGLVSLVPYFQQILKSAMRNIHSCSNDPLCFDQKIRPGKYNGAACYACLLLSETSCSKKNLHLDRNILIENR